MDVRDMLIQGNSDHYHVVVVVVYNTVFPFVFFSLSIFTFRFVTMYSFLTFLTFHCFVLIEL